MKILAIDTATDVLSAALDCDGSIYYLEIDAGLQHSERVIGIMDTLINLAGIRAQDLDLLACMKGPGSFTGLRIGFSAVKGIALSLSIPYIAVPSLDCMAAFHAVWPGTVLPLIDAKKNSFFGALYRNGKRFSDYFDLEAQKILDFLDPFDTILVTGPDAERAAVHLAEHGGSRKVHIDTAGRTGKARELLNLASHQFKKTGRGEEGDSGPLYIRKSDAELSRITVSVPGGACHESNREPDTRT